MWGDALRDTQEAMSPESSDVVRKQFEALESGGLRWRDQGRPRLESAAALVARV